MLSTEKMINYIFIFNFSISAPAFAISNPSVPSSPTDTKNNEFVKKKSLKNKKADTPSTSNLDDSVKMSTDALSQLSRLNSSSTQSKFNSSSGFGASFNSSSGALVKKPKNKDKKNPIEQK